jgi:toxin-antitoxin system PIN domain toxin
VKLVDANLLLYAYNSDSAVHAAARLWWEDALSVPEPVLLAWATILAFIRLATNPNVFARPFSPEEACDAVGTWLALPQVHIALPGDRHWQTFERIVRDSRAHGNLVSDAALAALAQEHGATIYTTDRDFRRFAGVRVANPLDA